MELMPGVVRPDPYLQNPLVAPDLNLFLSTAAFSKGRVLTLGEQDYSFSLAVAKVQFQEIGTAQIVATSYLAAHDPEEPEVHVRDDGERTTYSRKSLPSMDGALLTNIAELEILAVEFITAWMQLICQIHCLVKLVQASSMSSSFRSHGARCDVVWIL